MKTLLLSTVLAFTFLSCSKSPEAAAQDVCDCYKALGDSKMDQIIIETKECTKFAEKFRSQFEGEELKTYTLGIADCVTGGLFK